MEGRRRDAGNHSACLAGALGRGQVEVCRHEGAAAAPGAFPGLAFKMGIEMVQAVPGQG